jgi:hypothetical protein
MAEPSTNGTNGLNGHFEHTSKSEVAPPPKVWLARDPPFEGYVEPQPDGYEKSARLQSEGEPAAIVIDNGEIDDYPAIEPENPDH